jgi:hypothetical protein
VRAVDFIEEGRPNAVGHEGIKALKDEVPWCFLPGFAEEFPELELGRDKAIRFAKVSAML